MQNVPHRWNSSRLRVNCSSSFTCKPGGGSRRARCILPTSEMKRILLSALLLSGFMLAVAQVKKEDLATKNTKSPGTETSVTINGKNLWIYYHAPSVRGRHIFNGAGALQPDGSVWRLGADYATVLHTDATSAQKAPVLP